MKTAKALAGEGQPAQAGIAETLPATYVLPLRRDRSDPSDAELAAYLDLLSAHVEVIVVDASPDPVYSAHTQLWGDTVTQLRPAPALRCQNGKVWGVLTGLAAAGQEGLVIADDDVRYDLPQLRRLVDALTEADVVRPQNYFSPLPWHARWDTARSLINRATGGDWPGTLAVRRSRLAASGGYNGSVLFENLELVRTVQSTGGRERVLGDLFVRRQPPSQRQFWGQRVRQAYDEFARPWRLAVWLAVLPLSVALAARRSWAGLAVVAASWVGLAELGRRRDSGRTVFPASSSWLAPAWVLERGVCSWLAVGSRLWLGGVRYRGGLLTRAASSSAALRRRHPLSEAQS